VNLIMKKLALHWQILLGMVFGVLFAFILIQFTWGKDVIVDWVKPFGTIFINLLKLIAVPLILASLIKGISDLKDISKLSKMGGRTIGLYILTTVIAVSIGLVIVNIIKPGSFISEQTRTELVSSYTADANSKIEAANKQSEVGPLQSLIDIVPDNIIKASADNGNMLQVIFFAVIFGIAMILLPEDKSKPVKDFFDSFNEIILKMIDIIMLFSPIGVFALLAAIVAESPSLDLFKALGMYGLTVIIGLILVMSFYLFLVKVFAKKSPKFFINGISPAQLLAFSTSSSAATLPVTMERTVDNLGVDDEVASFVLPIGATINMDGTSLYQAVAAVFIALIFWYGFIFSYSIRNYCNRNFSFYRKCCCSWCRNGNVGNCVSTSWNSRSWFSFNFCH